MPVIGPKGLNLPTPVVPVRPQPSNGFVPPKCDLSIPDNLGRAPTSADVKVNAGFDGRSPAEAASMVLNASTTPVAAQNKAFVQQTATDVQKAFTIAVNNAFVAGSPFTKVLAAKYPGASFSVLGNMSEVSPVMIQVTLANKQQLLFQSQPGGTFAQVPKNPYKVVMQADLQFAPSQGVRVTYPKWSVPALSGPTATVTEG